MNRKQMLAVSGAAAVGAVLPAKAAKHAAMVAGSPETARSRC